MNSNTKSYFFDRTEPETPIRRRNHSLGSKPTDSAPLILPPAVQAKDVEPIVSYRRHRLQAKIQKWRGSKGGARLCQESINIYNTLKQEVTSKKIEAVLPVTNKVNSPKLYIRDIGILPVESGVMKKKVRTHRNFKIRTQKSPQKIKSIQAIPSKYRAPGQNLFPPKRQLIGEQSKKYNQLSVREMMETQEGNSAKYGMFIKLAQLRNRKNSVRYSSRRPSDDYSLDGW